MNSVLIRHTLPRRFWSAAFQFPFFLCSFSLLAQNPTDVASLTCEQAAQQLQELNAQAAAAGGCTPPTTVGAPKIPTVQQPGGHSSTTTSAPACVSDPAKADAWWSTHRANYDALVSKVASCNPSACPIIKPIPTQICVPAHLDDPKLNCMPNPDIDGDGISDALETKLIERFSPLLRFTIEKDGGSDKYRPMDMIDYVRNSDLVDHSGSLVLIPNSILAVTPSAAAANNILDTYKANQCRPGLDPKMQVALQGLMRNHDDNNPDAGTYDQGADWPLVMAQKNIGTYAHVSPFIPNSPSDLASHNGRMQDNGKPVIPASGYESTCGNDGCYKIEYYQFFGFNQAWADLGIGNHQADLAMLTEVYDVKLDQIVAVSHWAHGYEMRYDLLKASSKCTPDFDPMIGAEQTCRGENNQYSDFNILYVNLITGAHQSEPQKAQNNQLSFAQDPTTQQYSHPVVFVEAGSHEFWPSSKWSAQYAPSHAGNDPFHHYIAQNIPNLGEIEHPMSDDAKIITGYNGYWGNWNHDNDVSVGASLHSSWNWYVPNLTPIDSKQSER